MSSTHPQDLGTPLLLEDHLPVPSPATPTSSPLCAVCHTPTSLQRCSTCKSIHYCSPTCQTRDWPLHRLLCKKLLTSARPNPNDRRALLLPAETGKPRFIWLQYGDSGIPFNRGETFPATPVKELYTVGFHDRHLPYWIQVTYDKNLSSRALQPNETVKQLLSCPTDKLVLEWRGPLLVIAYSAEEGLSKPALDVGVEVLGPLCEYLRLRREYAGPVFVEQPQVRYGDEEWRRIVGAKAQK